MRALLIVVAFAACRDKEPTPAPAAGSARPVARPGAAATSLTRPANAPSLSTVDAGPDPRGMLPAQAFAAQQPDPDWAPQTESKLRARLPTFSDAKITCKETICEIAVAGDQMKAVDQIQDLSDVAANVTLTQDNGQLRAYLRFDRHL